MNAQLTPRERRLAEEAQYKLRAEHVDITNGAAARECLLRCVAGRLLWQAWEKWAAIRVVPQQLSFDMREDELGIRRS